MKKNSKLCLAILSCVLLLAIVALGACNRTTYVLRFETNGGTPIAPIEFKAGKKVPVPTTTKEYFTFDGWYADAEFTTPFDQFDNLPAQNLTVYAKWIAGESGKIIFVTNSDDKIADMTGVVGQTITPPANPTKTGYVFGGWYRSPEFTSDSFYVFGTFESGVLTLYAKWNRDSNFHYVTYLVNGVKTEVPVAAGQKATAPPTEEGTECIWYVDDDYVTEYDFDKAVTDDVTLYGLKYSKGLTFNGGAVTGYNGESNQIFVPSKYDGTTITSIGAGAFEFNNNIQYVLLPETVTAIGQTAFYKCEYLLTVNLTSNVKTIGAFAFSDCSRMASAVDLSGLTVIEENAFANCSTLSEVDFGQKLTEVGANAFVNCANLSKAELPDTVLYVYSYAFAYSGITKLNIPASLTVWGTGVVKGCEKLEEITGGNSQFTVDSDNGTFINGSTLLLYFTTETNRQDNSYSLPPRIQNVAAYAFYNNENIKELDVSASLSATPLTKSSLEGMKALETLTVKDFNSNKQFLAYWFGADKAQDNTSSGLLVPATLREVTFKAFTANELSSYAFYGARGLSKINGLEKVVKIGEYAYAYTALTSFNFSNSVREFANTAFRGTKTLGEITVDSGNAYYKAYDGALYNKAGTTLIYVPEAKTEIAFASTATTISAGAMYQSRVTELTVPNSIEQIGRGAFENMNRLHSLTVPFIGGSADQNRYMLYVFGATATVGDNGNPSISADKCPASLRTITVTGSLTAIPANAFVYCTNVSTVNLTGNYTTIGSGAFAKTALTEVVIPESVTEIGNYAFYDSDSIKKVVIGKNVTKIGDLAFAVISSLQSIEFAEGENDLTIGRAAFLAQTSTSNGVTTVYSDVTELKLSNNVTSIGQSAFSYVGVYGELPHTNAAGEIVEGDAEYAYIELIFDVANSRLKTIGDAAFGVAGISKVVLPATVESIGTIAFGGCDVLSEVTIGSAEHEATKLTTIDGGAFSENAKLKSFTLYKTVASANDVPKLTSGRSDLVGDKGYGVFELTSAQIYVPASSVEFYQSAWNTTLNPLADYIVAIREA